MLKNGFKLLTAGIIGGLVTFGLIYTFPNLDNNNTTQSRVNVTEKEKVQENSFKTVNANPYINKENSTLDFTSAAEKTVNSVVHIQSKFIVQQQSDPLIEFFLGPKPKQSKPSNSNRVRSYYF